MQGVSWPCNSPLEVQIQPALRHPSVLLLDGQCNLMHAPCLQIIKVAGTISAIRDAIELLMQHWGQNPSGRELSTSSGDRLRLRMLVPKVTLLACTANGQHEAADKSRQLHLRHFTAPFYLLLHQARSGCQQHWASLFSNC